MSATGDSLPYPSKELQPQYKEVIFRREEGGGVGRQFGMHSLFSSITDFIFWQEE